MTSISILIMAGLVSAITGVSAASRYESQADARSTAAYDVLILRRAVVKAELAARKETLTAQHPDVRRVADELFVLDLEIERVLATEPSERSQLSSVYGRLVLKRVALKVEERELRRQYTSEHPMLRQKHKELNALDQEI
jgi:hypothetical protein